MNDLNRLKTWNSDISDFQRWKNDQHPVPDEGRRRPVGVFERLRVRYPSGPVPSNEEVPVVLLEGKLIKLQLTNLWN